MRFVHLMFHDGYPAVRSLARFGFGPTHHAQEVLFP